MSTPDCVPYRVSYLKKACNQKNMDTWKVVRLTKVSAVSISSVQNFINSTLSEMRWTQE